MRAVVSAGLAVLLCLVAVSASRAACSDEIGKLMSRDTEKLTTRYNRVSARLEREKSSPKLAAERCAIARKLEPQLAGQISALKQSSCSKDAQMAAMVADIVRGHEDDLAAMRKSTATTCR